MAYNRRYSAWSLAYSSDPAPAACSAAGAPAAIAVAAGTIAAASALMSATSAVAGVGGAAGTFLSVFALAATAAPAAGAAAMTSCIPLLPAAAGASPTAAGTAAAAADALLLLFLAGAAAGAAAVSAAAGFAAADLLLFLDAPDFAVVATAATSASSACLSGSFPVPRLFLPLPVTAAAATVGSSCLLLSLAPWLRLLLADLDFETAFAAAVPLVPPEVGRGCDAAEASLDATAAADALGSFCCAFCFCCLSLLPAPDECFDASACSASACSAAGCAVTLAGGAAVAAAETAAGADFLGLPRCLGCSDGAAACLVWSPAFSFDPDDVSDGADAGLPPFFLFFAGSGSAAASASGSLSLFLDRLWFSRRLDNGKAVSGASGSALISTCLLAAAEAGFLSAAFLPRPAGADFLFAAFAGLAAAWPCGADLRFPSFCAAVSGTCGLPTSSSSAAFFCEADRGLSAGWYCYVVFAA
eukprot:GHUV01024190.1.p1 GENE.GHUV01024190.1~~GHUV01024190.1.p1  ORF type:complete len:472 (-),score=172.71 GHUV01024190.1:36-1451(-)